VTTQLQLINIIIILFLCFIPSILCAKQFLLHNTQTFYQSVFLECLNNNLTHFGYNLTDCLFRTLEKVLQSCVRFAYGQISQCYCQALFNWDSCSEPGISFHNFRPKKLTSISKSAGAIRVKFFVLSTKFPEL